MLEVIGVRKEFAGRGKRFVALDDVNLSIARGASLGLVGESGSGKTTLARCILGLETVTAGRIIWDGIDLCTLNAAERKAMRRRIQVVFQDPYASLNPRMSVRDIIAEPLVVNRDAHDLTSAQITERVRELLVLVGLGDHHLWRYPHEFSGGQRQRIGIARALALHPELLILDEPTSALDVSVQAQVLNLLDDLQRRLNLTYLFISHDLGVIRTVCDHVTLLYHGKIVESGPTAQVFDSPREDYTRQLLNASPEPDPSLSLWNRSAQPETAHHGMAASA
ncbi:MAG: ATP-binding cassette domain-containing protein [Burkholderiaceae bacterium]